VKGYQYHGPRGLASAPQKLVRRDKNTPVAIKLS
jgi:hypothetical protein